LHTTAVIHEVPRIGILRTSPFGHSPKFAKKAFLNSSPIHRLVFEWQPAV
jgi:hypothetical protein